MRSSPYSIRSEYSYDVMYDNVAVRNSVDNKKGFWVKVDGLFRLVHYCDGLKLCKVFHEKA